MRFAAVVLCTALTSFVLTCPSSADVIYSQDFTESDSVTGLPPAWSLGPRAHVPYFSSARDNQTFGAAPPSIRVDLPMLTLNYRLATPHIRLPRMDQDYTLEFALQVDQPDSPFRVEIVYMDLDTNWIRSEFLLSLVGEQMDSLRVFRIPFNPKIGPQAGRCWITFGLSYSKVLREGEAFPNPAGDHVTLRLLGPEVPETIGLYGVDGRLLGSSEVTTSTTYEGVGIGFASWSFRNAADRELPSGIYLARAPDGTAARIVKIR